MMEEKVFNGELNISTGDANTSALILNMISRICKTIMRKLSVTHDTGFRGRVQKLIASVFPLTHPSGLNRVGSFNTKNETNYEKKEEIEGENPSDEDYKLYKNFWSL